MKLDTNLFAAKPPSLEEGPRRDPQPEAIVANRVEIRSHYQRCVQVLKVILYLELILFVGWLGCVSMAKYYEQPQYNNVAMSFADPDGKNDSSDDQQLKEPVVHMEPLVQEQEQEILQESSDPSTETVPSEMHSPIEAYFVWMAEDDPLPTSTELSHSEATTEPVVEAGKDLIDFANNPTKSTSDEKDASDLDMSLSKWLEEMADTKSKSDDPYGILNLEKLFNDDDAGIDSGLLTSDKNTDDLLGLDEPFKSFEERWKKIMASIDEDLNAPAPKFDSTEDLQVPVFLRIPHFGELDPLSNEDSVMGSSDPLFALPFLHELLLNPSYLDEFRDSDESDSSSDLVNLANLHFGFDDPLVNERNFWRNVRDTGAKDDSDSKSSSEETTTPATKTKRSPNSSSSESDESADSSSGEDIVEKMMMKTLSPTCPKILGDDGKPIETREGVFARIKRSWHKLLLETPVPNCGDDDVPKIITIDECGKFVIECKPSGVKNETVEELLNTKPQVR